MIQRIQSFYLLLTIILSVLFLTGNIFRFLNEGSSEFAMNFRGIYEVASQNNYSMIRGTVPVLLLSVSIPVISLFTIFLFRNRKLQNKLTISLILLDILLIGAVAYIAFLCIKNYGGTLIPSFRMIIPALNIVLLILVFRSIKKDENLVRSYDRLR